MVRAPAARHPQRFTDRSNALLGIGLPPETSVSILAYEEEEIVNGRNFWGRFVTMPLQIGTAPENLPAVFRPDKGCLCKRLLSHLARFASPDGTNLKDLNALAVDSKTEIELRPDMRRWAVLLEERAHRLPYACQLKLAQRHLGRCLTSALSGPREARPARRRCTIVPRACGALAQCCHGPLQRIVRRRL